MKKFMVLVHLKGADKHHSQTLPEVAAIVQKFSRDKMSLVSSVEGVMMVMMVKTDMKPAQIRAEIEASPYLFNKDVVFVAEIGDSADGGRNAAGNATWVINH